MIEQDAAYIPVGVYTHTVTSAEITCTPDKDICKEWHDTKHKDDI